MLASWRGTASNTKLEIHAVEEPLRWDDLHALNDELRAMARGLLACENNAQSLSPTALILTALRRQKPGGWKTTFEDVEISWPTRRIFFGQMYRAMWQALTEHARKRRATKTIRASHVEQSHLDNLVHTADERPEQILALKIAIERLREQHPEWAELIEHRYISGLTLEECARVMGMSPRTIGRRFEKDWEYYRALLHDEIEHILKYEDLPSGNLTEDDRDELPENRDDPPGGTKP
jgi:AraC-like DNA-binding protein